MQLFRFKHYLVFFSAVFFISGCSLWSNFTTYFNLYYNTSDIFEQAEIQIYEQKRSLFSPEELTIPGTVNTQLIKVIEKCSEILQFHSSSSYVDDALLMLGKSFYYQKNYQKAQRKFEELLTMEESEHILETNLWIGKTLMRLKSYERALTILGEVREEAIEKNEEEIIKNAFVEEIIYRIIREDYQQAIILSNELLATIKNNDIKAEVLYEVGKLHIKVDEPENAIAAFQKVLNYSPDYEIELDTKLELGKTLRIVGSLEDAVAIFNKMRDEAKFIDAYNRIDLQIGITQHELGQIEEAVEKLTFVDTSYINTPSSAIAKYRLGEIYEYDYLNYDSAGAYYQRALVTSLPNEYMSLVSQKVRTFKKWQHLTSEITKNRSQLFYIENPDEYTKDSSAYVRDSIAYVRDSLQVLEELTLFSEHLKFLAGFDTTSVNDSVFVADSLFNDSTIVLDSAQIDSIKQIERELAIKNEIARQGVNVDSLFAENWDSERRFPVKPIRPAISEDSLKLLLVRNEVELGNLFLTEMERSDSAYFYYNDVITNYPNTKYHANALYALGSYYLNTNEKERADSLFNVIYENYKTENIVNAAANQLKKPLIDLEFDPAKEIYADAEFELIAENYNSSLNKFLNIYKEYPKSSVAPKALYTSGYILENELNLHDSAAVIYDTLTIRYPQSEYTRQVRSKLSAYKQHLAEIQQAIEDSLRRIEEEKLNLFTEDSLGVIPDSVSNEYKKPGYEDAVYPDSEFEELKHVETPEIKQTDTSRNAILNNPRRNPRKK